MHALVRCNPSAAHDRQNGPEFRCDVPVSLWPAYHEDDVWDSAVRSALIDPTYYPKRTIFNMVKYIRTLVPSPTDGVYVL